mgnify:CR=1 FL=1
MTITEKEDSGVKAEVGLAPEVNLYLIGAGLAGTISYEVQSQKEKEKEKSEKTKDDK